MMVEYTYFYGLSEWLNFESLRTSCTCFVVVLREVDIKIVLSWKSTPHWQDA